MIYTRPYHIGFLRKNYVIIRKIDLKDQENSKKEQHSRVFENFFELRKSDDGQMWIGHAGDTDKN